MYLQKLILFRIAELRPLIEAKKRLQKDHEDEVKEYHFMCDTFEKMESSSLVIGSHLYDSEHTPRKDLDHFCTYNSISKENKKELLSIISGFIKCKID